MTSIGRRWKGGDARSRAVLIARAFPSHKCVTRVRGGGKSAPARAPRPSRGCQATAPRHQAMARRTDNQAAMAAGPHLFPSRTEKLSPPAPMVLRTSAGE